MIRGQFFFYVHDGKTAGRRHVGGVGIIEAPIGTFEPERILGLVAASDGDSLIMGLTGYAKECVEDHGEDIAHHAIYHQWPAPDAESGFSGGGILLRRTMLPAREGHETMCAVTCLSTTQDMVQDRRMYAMAAAEAATGGRGILTLRDPTECPELSKTSGLRALLRTPVWGWEDEKVGLRSTMTLETIAETQEVRRLLGMSKRTADEDARLERLKRTSPGWHVIANTEGDADFAEFMKRMPATLRDDDWSMPVTASQHAERERVAADIVRGMKAA